jgi:energy-coupling factor transporter transmembrane protein EcfT
MTNLILIVLGLIYAIIGGFTTLFVRKYYQIASIPALALFSALWPLTWLLTLLTHTFCLITAILIDRSRGE